MPTTIQLPDPAEAGESDHIGDHNTIVAAVDELQTLSDQHLLDTDIVAGTNVTVTPGAGNSVTVAVPTAPSHTHAQYALESSPDTLQQQIDDLSSTVSGSITYNSLPIGSLVVVDKAKTEPGHDAGNWPTIRPTSRTDLTVMWKGDTDPANNDPNPVLPQDIWFRT